MKYVELTDKTYDEAVSTGVVMVDYHAKWCGPCRAMGPAIDNIAAKYEGRATIAKINTDENQETAVKNGIRSIPTIIFYKDGNVMKTLMGSQSEATLADTLNELIGE